MNLHGENIFLLDTAERKTRLSGIGRLIDT